MNSIEISSSVESNRMAIKIRVIFQLNQGRSIIILKKVLYGFSMHYLNKWEVVYKYNDPKIRISARRNVRHICRALQASTTLKGVNLTQKGPKTISWGASGRIRPVIQNQRPKKQICHPYSSTKVQKCTLYREKTGRIGRATTTMTTTTTPKLL